MAYCFTCKRENDIVKIVKTENNAIVTTIHLQNLKTLLGFKNCNALANDML